MEAPKEVPAPRYVLGSGFHSPIVAEALQQSLRNRRSVLALPTLDSPMISPMFSPNSGQSSLTLRLVKLLPVSARFRLTLSALLYANAVDAPIFASQSVLLVQITSNEETSPKPHPATMICPSVLKDRVGNKSVKGESKSFLKALKKSRNLLWGSYVPHIRRWRPVLMSWGRFWGRQNHLMESCLLRRTMISTLVLSQNRPFCPPQDSQSSFISVGSKVLGINANFSSTLGS
ncbi:hypothetical protein C8R47DRAFT_1121603 [Mycena vitilis]|nr:hypothetical protein C8R47DRAFT_1121603 [Mycena vitilis]